MKQPIVEIVIIFKAPDDYVLESIKKCLELKYSNYSILLLPDAPWNPSFNDERIRIIHTGAGNIPFKRNKALQEINDETEFIAYIDADAFPSRDWLEKGIAAFSSPQVAAVGGPNLTPSTDSPCRQITGRVMCQELAFGSGAIRHKICTSRFVNELPTCNLLIRRNIHEAYPFDDEMSTGEDADICLRMVRGGYKIFYSSDMIVFHHRRAMIKPFLNQFYYYGFHKGVLFYKNRLPSLYQVIPCLMVIYIIAGGAVSLFVSGFSFFWTMSLVVYGVLCMLSSFLVQGKKWLTIPAALGVIMGHLAYGTGFLVALLMKLFANIGGGKTKVGEKC